MSQMVPPMLGCSTYTFPFEGKCSFMCVDPSPRSIVPRRRRIGMGTPSGRASRFDPENVPTAPRLLPGENVAYKNTKPSSDGHFWRNNGSGKTTLGLKRKCYLCRSSRIRSPSTGVSKLHIRSNSEMDCKCIRQCQCDVVKLSPQLEWVGR